MNKKDCYQVGYISKTHGLKGELTVVFSEPIELTDLSLIFVDLNGNLIPYFIESFSDRTDKAFIKFEEINTPEQAGQLKGCGLFLNKENRPGLKRGSFYNDEVIGFSVEDNQLGELGNITHVIQSGLSRLLQVNFNGKEILIPTNGPFIKSVNKSKKSVKVDLPEGFLDI
jgi:16S rRNA processing protein RimM